MASKAKEALMMKGKKPIPMVRESEVADGPIMGKAYTKDIVDLKNKKEILKRRLK